MLFVSTSSANPDRVSQALAVAERIRGLAAERREIDLALARALAELDTLGQWHVVGCGSAGQFGERCGVGARDVRTLLDLGRALAVAPEVEPEVRAGTITVEAAGSVGEVIATPGLLRPGDDWIGWARTESTKVLRERVQQRKEEARLGDERARPLTVYVGQAARDDFAKARAIASRRAGHLLSPGQTFALVNRHYVATHDDDRVMPPRRRAPPTASAKGRYVPRAVRHEVHARQRGRCAVPLCGNSIFVEMAHLVAHRFGGGREADNLLLLCSAHHKDFDSGWLTVEGTAAHPRFFDRSGNDLSERLGTRPVGPPGDARRAVPSTEPPRAPSGSGPPDDRA